MHDAMMIGNVLVLIIPCSNKPLPKRKYEYGIGFSLGSGLEGMDGSGFYALCRNRRFRVNNAKTQTFLHAWPLGRPCGGK